MAVLPSCFAILFCCGSSGFDETLPLDSIPLVSGNPLNGIFRFYLLVSVKGFSFVG